MGSSPISGTIFVKVNPLVIKELRRGFFVKWCVCNIVCNVLPSRAYLFSGFRINLRQQFDDIVEIFHTYLSFQ